MSEHYRMSLANIYRVSQPSIEFFQTHEQNGSQNEFASEDPKEIKVSVEFLRFGEIDTMNEKYYAEICIEATWAINKPLKTYDPNVDWNPKLYIENSLLEPKEEISYEIKRLYDMVIIKEIKFIKGYFWEKLELENFPLDIQELSIVLTSKLKYTQLEFKTDPEKPALINYKASKIFVDQQKWYLYKFVKVSDYASYDLPNSDGVNHHMNLVESNTTTLPYLVKPNNETRVNMTRLIMDGSRMTPRLQQAKFVASCFCARRAGYYMFNAYFIIFLITTLSLSVFSISCKNPHARLQTTFTLVLTSASFKWVINRSLPTISYMTSLDKYALASIFYLCMLCIWHALIGTFWSDEAQLDFIVFCAFIAVFVVIHVVLVVWLFMGYKRISDFEKINQNYIREKRVASMN